MFTQPCPVFLDDGFDDAGVVTPEYALLMLGAAALAILLLFVARSEPVRQAITELVMRALDPPS
jgi:hypothetical protein